jgi:hypothetical protein
MFFLWEKLMGDLHIMMLTLSFLWAINLVGMTRLPALFLLVKFWMGVILDLYLGLKGVHVQNFLFQMGQSAFQCKVIVNL